MWPFILTIKEPDVDGKELMYLLRKFTASLPPFFDQMISNLRGMLSRKYADETEMLLVFQHLLSAFDDRDKPPFLSLSPESHVSASLQYFSFFLRIVVDGRMQDVTESFDHKLPIWNGSVPATVFQSE